MITLRYKEYLEHRKIVDAYKPQIEPNKQYIQSVRTLDAFKKHEPTLYHYYKDRYQRDKEGRCRS